MLTNLLIGTKYPTYQVFVAIFVAGLITALLMPAFIRVMRKDGIGQQVRADGPQTHLVKQGTPTMGGVIMLAGALVTCALFARWTPDLILCVAATIATGMLGLLDDIESVSHGRSLGLTPSQKMTGLIVISVAFCLLAVNWVGVPPTLAFPGDFTIDLGVLSTTIGGVQVPWLYLAFVFLLLAGLSNAVNLTDGLDGLSSGTVMVVMLAMAMVAYGYDEINLSVFAGACAGACVGRERDHAGCELQDHGQAHLSYGAAPPPLREEGLERDEGGHSLLDRERHVRGGWLCAVLPASLARGGPVSGPSRPGAGARKG